MTTIPASQLVRIIPNVLSAGGAALVMNGLILSASTRIPIGEVLSFPNDGVSVAAYFGPSAAEVETANVYFNGFDNSTEKPASILFAQYPASSVAAWLRGGPVGQLTLPQLKALTGSLTVVMDGYTYTNASFSLSAATSFSAAAALIETALNNSLPSAASVTGAIAAGTGSVTASISGSTMYVTDVASGSLVPGSLLSGTGVSAGTRVTSQLSGTAGGIGEYAVSIPQAKVSDTVTSTHGVLTVTAVSSGTLTPGQVLSGSGVTANTTITGYGTGEGLTGTYYVGTTQTASSTAITATGAPLDVQYDSVSEAFVIYSGWAGSESTAAFATGTLSASLYLTEDTGAMLSQGTYAETPASFMTSITELTQNWGTFMTMFDPDLGEGSPGRQAFAEWTNDQSNRWMYVAWDDDITPTLSGNASSSFGAIVNAAGMSGTCVVYDPNEQNIAAFVCGAAASIDFEATNGRITFAFKGQAGLVAGVTTATAAANLIANGYNFYGAYATANQEFLQLQNGSVSGAFQWADSYVNQIWLNNALQQALMVLLTTVNSVPYNAQGYALIKAACADPILAAVNFGAIRAGVTLSEQQKAYVNNTAGVRIDDVLQAQGWYLQVKDAAPLTRQARQSPPCNFWYMDGQSVQQIVLNSVLVQ